MKQPDPYKKRLREMYATLRRAAGRQPHATMEELRKEFDYALLRPFCPHCSTTLSPSNVSLDHRLPASRGGSHRIENLQFTCGRCNKSKGCRTAEEFADIIEALDAIGRKRRNPGLRDEILGELMRHTSFKAGAIGKRKAERAGR